MSPWLLGLVALLVLGIVLEGRRQERRYGKPSGQGGALMRAGVLGLQQMLEPDKKVQIVLEQREQVEDDDAGDRGGPLPPLH